MEVIHEGASGAAVEDIQERLGSLSYKMDAHERAEKLFGHSTATAVARFRLDHDLPLGEVVDAPTWATLVDECYQLGDRTLYLRLPNFHGNDVHQLQERLNILGFSCGESDGVYGVHTEAAVKLFQESVGALADGMAFPDTFDAIERLRHVWAGKPAAGPHPQGGIGFARAASVLEDAGIAITASDPISRNVAGRIWNLAHATVENCGIELVDAPADASAETRALIVLSSTPLPAGEAAGVGNVALDDTDTLPLRLQTAIQSSSTNPRAARVELPVGKAAFTMNDAQTFAVLLLDAICVAFDRLEL
ncbi:peptidoglycan-binding domain-containing protein [Thermophilibacter immobilis]|uniref:Peptidoglycan-binding protein n=1 Tax=Thermophilibacter immobilis TaxID=2779519 RepID=A0A7S7M8Y1_9ACTN|nr:peptidoglycan-binding protein [Thermophilibacter immobilis]QOY60925.1 peptidoglycan-binding protein [Thermophilibacter immobilis]